MKELPEDLQEKITAYIDGALPAAEAAALEVYLSNTDPALADMVIGMLADRHSVQNLPKIAAPHDLAARVMEQVERSTLLHGVEHDVGRRPWWQSRSAIAAGVAIVIGGFSYFVIHSIYRPQPQWKQVVSGEPVAKEGERAATAGPGGLADTGQKAPDNDDARLIASRGVSEDELAKQQQFALSNAAKADAPEVFNDRGGVRPLIIDTTTTPEERLRITREVLANLGEAAEKGYVVEQDLGKALANVRATPDAWVDGPPVLMTLVARDAQDARRLENALRSFIGNDDASAAAQQDVTRSNYYTTNKSLQINNTLGVTGNYTGQNSVTGGNLSVGNTTTANMGLGTTQATSTQQNGFNGDYRRYEFRNQDQFSLNGAARATQQQRFEQQYRDPVSKDGSRNFDKDASYSNAKGTMSRAGESARGDFSGNAGAPYRVYLRADQLKSLSQEFQVASVARGQLAYVISPDDGKQRKVADGVPGDAEKFKALPHTIAKPGGDAGVGGGGGGFATKLAEGTGATATPAAADVPNTAGAAPADTRDKKATPAEGKLEVTASEEAGKEHRARTGAIAAPSTVAAGTMAAVVPATAPASSVQALDVASAPGVTGAAGAFIPAPAAPGGASGPRPGKAAGTGMVSSDAVGRRPAAREDSRGAAKAADEIVRARDGQKAAAPGAMQGKQAAPTEQPGGGHADVQSEALQTGQQANVSVQQQSEQWLEVIISLETPASRRMDGKANTTSREADTTPATH